MFFALREDISRRRIPRLQIHHSLAVLYAHFVLSLYSATTGTATPTAGADAADEKDKDQGCTRKYVPHLRLFLGPRVDVIDQVRVIQRPNVLGLRSRLEGPHCVIFELNGSRCELKRAVRIHRVFRHEIASSCCCRAQSRIASTSVTAWPETYKTERGDLASIDRALESNRQVRVVEAPALSLVTRLA